MQHCPARAARQLAAAALALPVLPLAAQNDNPIALTGDVKAGTPYVTGAKVVGVVEDHTRGPKIRVFKSKRRKQERRTHWFRADQTRVRITSIQA